MAWGLQDSSESTRNGLQFQPPPHPARVCLQLPRPLSCRCPEACSASWVPASLRAAALVAQAVARAPLISRFLADGLVLLSALGKGQTFLSFRQHWIIIASIIIMPAGCRH